MIDLRTLSMKEEVEDLDAQITELEGARDLLVAKLQKKCKHPHEALRECDYVPHDYLSSMPPMRVCMICGTWEDGWGCGYQTLKSKSKKAVPIIPRDEVYEYRRGEKVGD